METTIMENQMEKQMENEMETHTLNPKHLIPKLQTLNPAVRLNAWLPPQLPRIFSYVPVLHAVGLSASECEEKLAFKV